MRLIDVPVERKSPFAKWSSAITASGIEHTVSDQAKVLSRSRLVTIAAIIQKNTSALMNWSVRTATLPLSHIENGRVSTVHPNSATVIDVSDPDGVIGSRRSVASIVCAAMATPAASRAIRMVFSTGRNVCGESSRTTVKNTSPPKASDLPPAPWITGDASTSGRHQVALVLLSATADLLRARRAPSALSRRSDDLVRLDRDVHRIVRRNRNRHGYRDFFFDVVRCGRDRSWRHVAAHLARSGAEQHDRER